MNAITEGIFFLCPLCKSSSVSYYFCSHQINLVLEIPQTLSLLSLWLKEAKATTSISLTLRCTGIPLATVQKVFLSLSTASTNQKLSSTKQATTKQTWRTSTQLAVFFKMGRWQWMKIRSWISSMRIVKENPHYALNCSHIRLSHKSHMVPLDVILGLSVETLFGFYFFL